MSQPTYPLSSYTGETFRTTPTFGLYRTDTASLITDLDDQFSLSAFTDSACTQAASSAFSITDTKMSLTTGTASFSGATYSLAAGTSEVGIYFKVRSEKLGISGCSRVFGIGQKFGSGAGYLRGGATGAAGGTTTNTLDYGISVRTDSQNRIIACGQSRTTGNAMAHALWRSHPNATLDTTFGGVGTGYQVYQNGVNTGLALATGLVGGTCFNDGCSAMALDSSDRIYTTGFSKNLNGGIQLGLWRFTADGSPDTAFAAAGGVLGSTTGAATGGATAANQFDLGRAIMLDSSAGQVIVAGQSRKPAGGNEMAIWKFTTSGSLVSSFGSSGAVTFGTPGVAGLGGATMDDRGYAVSADSSGNLFVTGISYNSSTRFEAVVWKVNSAGVLQASYRSAASGTGLTGSSNSAGTFDENFRSAALDSSGRLVATGWSRNTTTTGDELIVVRLKSDLTLDTTFGSGGFYRSGTTGYAGGTGANQRDRGFGLIVDRNGKIVVAGYSRDNSATPLVKAMFVRFTSSGELDTTFGTGGYVVYPTAVAGGTVANYLDEPMGLTQDSFGRYVAVGRTKSNAPAQELAIWRVLETGAIDQ